MPSKKPTKKASAKGTAKKAASNIGATKARRAAAASSGGGGFQTFAMHVNAPTQERAFKAMRAKRSAHPSFALTAGSEVATLDPETLAQGYLRQALDSSAVPSFTAPVADGQRVNSKASALIRCR